MISVGGLRHDDTAAERTRVFVNEGDQVLLITIGFDGVVANHERQCLIKAPSILFAAARNDVQLSLGAHRNSRLNARVPIHVWFAIRQQNKPQGKVHELGGLMPSRAAVTSGERRMHDFAIDGNCGFCFVAVEAAVQGVSLSSPVFRLSTTHFTEQPDPGTLVPQCPKT